MPTGDNKGASSASQIRRYAIIAVVAVLVFVFCCFAISRWKGASVTLQPQHANRGLAQSQGTDKRNHRYTNQLIHQTSPYLLQHAHNPVNWYAWGPDALAKARSEDKPIFLSIGYSTCYWCHVMEKQSFEDEEVAEILNKHFIAIKVDREERPDIDEQYMLATQLVTGRGGWPNSVWLTPDGKPWMAGTYFPKEQFIQVLETLSGYWKNRRSEVKQQAERIAQAIRQAAGGPSLYQPPSGVPSGRPADVPRTVAAIGSIDQKLIDKAVTEYQQTFDDNHGGFGAAPKFPPHGMIRVLVHEYRRTQDKTILSMIDKTLDAMWLGGIHDHLGGGFHRYSTDDVWLLPHFEKMLYDNAQLMRAYTDGYLTSGAPHYREAVEDIFNWLKNEMTSAGGGLYSAIDAGEVGKEGEFYLWRYEEIVEALGAGDASLFAGVYNVSQNGNFREESTGKKPGTNIIHLKKPLEKIAKSMGEEPEIFKTKIAGLRNKLLERRDARPPPHKDDKILTGWNSLMIGSLAYAGRTLNDPRYTETAVKAANFLLNNLFDEQGRLLRTYRAGQGKLPGYLDDYAYLAEGLMELHAATGEQQWLQRAQQLADVMLTEFEDKLNGGFFFTAATHEELFMRSKNLTGGGNVPAANGTAVLVLLELSRLTAKTEYARSAQRTLEALAGLMRQSPHSLDSAIYAAAVSLGYETPEQPQKMKFPNVDVTKTLGPVTAHLFSSHRNARPGQALKIGLALDIAEGWHLYGPNPKAKFLIATTISVSANDIFAIGGINEPAPRIKYDSVLQQDLAVYEGRVWFFVPVTIKKNAQDGEVTLRIQIKTQACDQNICLPPRTDEIEFNLNIASNTPDGEVRHAEVFKTIEKEKQ